MGRSVGPSIDRFEIFLNFGAVFGQRPRRGRSPVEHRGTFVRPFIRSSVSPPQALSGLKSALTDLKSTLSGLKSALSGLESEKLDFRPERVYFRPERARGDRSTDGWKDK